MNWGWNPAAESRQLSALSNAWTSNLLDYLTTLALIQSNNGAPNWGPNHATKHTVELLNRSGSTSTLTSHSSWSRTGMTTEMLNVESISLSRSYLCASGQVHMPLCKTCGYCLSAIDVRFLPLSLWKCLLCRRGNVLAPVAAVLSEATGNGNPTLLQRCHHLLF